MKPAQISWYITTEDKTSVVNEEHYAGSYNNNEEQIIFNVEVWNNKRGHEAVENVNRSNVVISFGTYEDSKLLEVMEIYLDKNSVKQDFDLIDNKAFLTLDKPLLGTPNEGLEGDIQNYRAIKLAFNTKEKNLSSGLKHLYLDLQFIK